MIKTLSDKRVSRESVKLLFGSCDSPVVAACSMHCFPLRLRQKKTNYRCGDMRILELRTRRRREVVAVDRDTTVWGLGNKSALVKVR